MKLAIIGGGSWGTALAIVLAPRLNRSRYGLRKGPHRALVAFPGENDIFLSGFQTARECSS